MSRAPSWVISAAPADALAALPSVADCPAAWPALVAPVAFTPSPLSYRAALLGQVTALETDAADVAPLAAQASAPTPAAASCEAAAAAAPRAANKVMRRRQHASTSATKRHAAATKAAGGQKSEQRQRGSSAPARPMLPAAAMKAACSRPVSCRYLQQPRRS